MRAAARRIATRLALPARRRVAIAPFSSHLPQQQPQQPQQPQPQQPQQPALQIQQAPSKALPAAIWSWGAGRDFQLGYAEPASFQAVPRRIQASTETGFMAERMHPTGFRRVPAAVQVTAAHSASLALLDAGDVWEWGALLGPWEEEDELWEPTDVLGFVDTPIVHIAAGLWHALAVTADGHVYAWGLGSNYQLGQDDGDEPLSSLEPLHVEALDLDDSSPFVLADGGGYHSVALNEEGRLWGWGFSGNGQLGDRATRPHTYPAPIDLPREAKTIHVSCGPFHTAAVTEGGVVYTMGGGALGPIKEDHELNDVPSPQVPASAAIADPVGKGTPRALDLHGARAKRVACGNGTTLVVTENGEVEVCGADGRLARVAGALANKAVVLGALNEGRGAAVTEDGELYMWKLPAHGDDARPERIMPDHIVDSVSLGWDFTLVSAGERVTKQNK